MPAKAAGLVDNKVASFSATHTALRLVIPVARRHAPDRAPPATPPSLVPPRCTIRGWDPTSCSSSSSSSSSSWCGAGRRPCPSSARPSVAGSRRPRPRRRRRRPRSRRAPPSRTLRPTPAATLRPEPDEPSPRRSEPSTPMLPDDLTALTRRPRPGRPSGHDRHRRRARRDARRPPAAARSTAVRRAQSVAGQRDAGHYHQGRLGRTFWRRLMTAGVLPATTEIETADDALMAAGHGITDLLKVPTPRDEATDADLTAGVGPLWQKIAIWRPAAIVFIYKRAASISAGRDLARVVGPPAGRRAGRPPVRPDARSLRAGRTGRRGAQLRAEPRRRLADRPGLGTRTGAPRPPVRPGPRPPRRRRCPHRPSASSAGSPTAKAASRHRCPSA